MGPAASAPRESAIGSNLEILELLLRRLGKRAALDEEDRRALLALPYRQRSVEPAVYVVREGQAPDHSCIVVAGFAIRHKVTAQGARQIVGIHIPGDFIDLEGALLAIADHNVQALTRCELAFVRRSAIHDLIFSRPRVGLALWIDTLVDAAIYREWVVNIGRRDARSRLAHFLCEFAQRLEFAGLGGAQGYELPMTQEQLADAIGLTAVHVNRVLKSLVAEGLIVRDRRFVRVPDPAALRAAGGYNDLYLHLDAPPPPGSRWTGLSQI